ncbi:MAG: HEPN domain-containing protein [Deltaproteobacteria bacterium]|nr:HEPN domain-containing protein [Deltaproteobacteria bacterium]MBW2015039.1 HEPN domain-containing protein [Deltaproteobacteria bacterium]
MKNLDKANEWLQRAKSNMARAKAGRVSPDILYEDLCYDAQQAVEKAFKSVCIIYEIVFPKTHDIAYLIELLEKGGVEVPENLQNAKILTGYAVETRYPGDYEPVDEEDLRKAIEIAKEVLKWVKKEMDKGQGPPDSQKSLFE